MFKAVASVRDEVLSRCAGDAEKIDLQTITKVFASLTIVDIIVFVQFDTPRTNPIWGEFARWSRSPSVYASAETVVEVRYAGHLYEDERRIVVCKELCHALEAAAGAHDVSQGGIDAIVGAFSVLSGGKITKDFGTGMRLELLAEVAATELLLPTHVRKQIIAQEGQPNDKALAALAQKYKLPLPYVVTAFEPSQIQVMEWLLENDA